jgi:hypothetical protein
MIPLAGAAASPLHSHDGVPMLSTLPFLISTNSFGIIALIIFLCSSVIFMIPAFANRGTAQFVWLGLGSFLLVAEGAVLITLLILVNNGTIWTGSLTY